MIDALTYAVNFLVVWTVLTLWLSVVLILVAWWGRPPFTGDTDYVGIAPRCVYGFRRIVSALRRRAGALLHNL